MAFSPTDSSLYSPLFSNPEMVNLFSDERSIRFMLEVEGALARSQGRLGVIPAEAAAQIAETTASLEVDLEALKADVEKTGVPVKELVRQLRQAVGETAARHVHRGATTQDVMDTALVLQARAALRLLDDKLQHVIQNLMQLTDRHRRTLMPGRTHAQQALPITFGLKAAGWMAPLLRHRQRLRELESRLFTVQFGGAAGTLASLGESGTAVQEELARTLDLSVPVMPWHTQRDNLAELTGWLSLVSGGLAKMAQDIILMAQSEVGEVRESSDRTRGGSSTMPQKSNPIVSELIVAAARANASLLSAMHGALIQEHERATHGWQLEWLSLPQMFSLTAAALDKALFLSENLEVDAARMRENVVASNGLMMAEAVRVALTEHMDTARAGRLVAEAVATALDENHHLVDVVRANTQAPLDWEALKDESAYLGSAEAFIERVLAAARAALKS